MNLTDQADPEVAITNFFRQQLLPLHRQLRDAGKRFFATQADPERETYFVPRDKTTLYPGDMEIPGCSTPADLEEKLREMWESQGNGELAAMAPALGGLAQLLCRRAEPGEEVSPFIYVMF